MTAALQAVTFTQDPQRTVSWMLNGHGLTHYDSAGCRWIHQKTTGWRGAAPPRTDRTDRPSASGSYPGQAYRNERVITLTGTCRAPSAAARADAEERIGQLIPDGTGLVVLRRTGENGVPQVRYVELDDVIDPVPINRTWFDWQLTLAAPDPRKFTPAWISVEASVAVASSGGVISTGSGVISTGLGVAAGTAARSTQAVAVGAGTVANPVVYELIGALADAYVSDVAGTSQVRYRGLLGAGESVFINCDSQPAHGVPGAAAPIPGYGALLGAYSARSAVGITGGRPTLLPGQSAAFALAGELDAGARLRVHTRGTWD